MKIILLTLGVFVLLAELSTQQSCDNNNIINGCSIPFNLPIRYRDTFRPACNRHDVCYRCGSTYGRSRATCDSSFRGRMMAICNRQNSRQSRCRSYANVYFNSVRIGGRGRYRQRSGSECSPSWVQGCL